MFLYTIFLDASKFLTDKKTHLHGKCVSSFMERVMGIVPNTEFTVSFSKYPSIKAKKTINYTKITSLIEVIFCFIKN